MAINHVYVDPSAAGNDHTGAAFVDGSFANATNTLTKVGAFAATVAEHQIYLTDNGSGEVTAGMYRVASVTDNDNVVLASDIRSGANDPTDVVCAQHAGTSALPYASMHAAIDFITDGAAGNQINLKAGTADVLAATIDWTNYSPTNSADNPLIIRGYTTAADDAGVGEIDGNNAVANIFDPGAFPNNCTLVDLKLHNTTGDVVDAPANSTVMRCELYNGGSAETLDVATACLVFGCNIHTGTAGAKGIVTTADARILFNRITGHDDLAINHHSSDGVFIGNLAHNIEHSGMWLGGERAVVYGNTFVGDQSAGNYALEIGEAGEKSVILSNIFKDFGSGGTGSAADFAAGSNATILGYNNLHGNDDDAYDNKTVFGLDLTAKDTLTDPTFTNAAGDDYSVGTNAQADGYPDTTAWPGASTNGYTEPGAVQRQEAGGGGGLLTHPGMTGGVRG